MIKILLLPFRIVWALISFIFNLTGRLLGVVIGIVLISVGLILAFTVIGAIVGIPLVVLGLLLTIRSLFK